MTDKMEHCDHIKMLENSEKNVLSKAKESMN